MIFIQSDIRGEIPVNFDSACAMYGAIENEQKYELIDINDVRFNTDVFKTNLAIGTVEFMQKVFKSLGISEVKLPKNSNRKSEIMTLEEALCLVSKNESRFIKPVQTKLFDGFVLDKCKYSCLKGIPLETKIYAYQPFEEEIDTEWRIYVHNHKIVGAGNYSGCFQLLPNFTKTEMVINENKTTFPIAYTIDVAVLRSGKFVVIEFNDMWAIGNYGLDNGVYLKMLKDRYFEIVRRLD